MTEKIIMAGAGGQGVMLLGKVISEAVMREDKFVTWLPSYGAEVRGGTAHCMVVISDTEIGSPYIDKADTLIVLNEPSLKRFRPRLKTNGLLLVNSSLIFQDAKDDAKAVKCPFTSAAVKLGNIKVANMVALGSYIAKKKIMQPKTVLKVIEDIAPPDRKDLVQINKRAVLTGMEIAK